VSAKERPVSAIAKTVTPRALAHPAQGEAGKGSESARRGRWGGVMARNLQGLQRRNVLRYASTLVVGLFSFIVGLLLLNRSLLATSSGMQVVVVSFPL